MSNNSSGSHQGMSTRLRLVLLVALVCLCSRAYADWINLTGSETAANIAEIYILDDAVKLVLEIYVGDLAAFAG